MNERDVIHAEELVVRDRRRGEPGLDYETALQGAVDLVDVDDVEGDDELAEAYRVVLAYRRSPTRRQLLDLVTALACEGVSSLTAHQRVWAWQAQRGALR